MFASCHRVLKAAPGQGNNHIGTQNTMDLLVIEDNNNTRGSDRLNETHNSSLHTDGVGKTIALPVFMFAGGAVGNIIAIVVLSLSRQQRKSSAFYTLVCGLAVTDLLGTCLASPLTIATYFDLHVFEDEHLCNFHSFLLLFFGVAGLSIICAMSAERYLAICCPYTYQRWGVGRRFAQKFLFFIYMSNITFCALPMMGMASSELQPSLTWCFIDWRAEEPVPAAYSFLYGSVSLLLILVTIVFNFAVCGTLLVMRQRTVQRPVTRSSVRERWRALSSAAETQMIAVLVVTSVVVLACSAPLVVRVFANQITLENDYRADLAAIRIASVNPILDPWIYILLRRSLFWRTMSLFKTLWYGRRKQLPPTPLRGLIYPEYNRRPHVLTDILCTTNIITQVPATVTFRLCDNHTQSLQQTN